MQSVIILLAVCCFSEMRVNASPFQKRQAASAAATASNAVASLVGPVTGTLNSGSGNIAMVRWASIPGLTYTLQLIHGKPVMNDANSHGGVVAITKRDLHFIGGEANVIFSFNGQVVGKVYLATYYSGAQPVAQPYFGQANFQSQTVTANGSTGLILAYIAPGNSAEVSSNQISYPVLTASNSYNAPSANTAAQYGV